MSYWIALFAAVLGNVAANASLKHFVQTTEFSMSWDGVITALSKPTLWIGLCCAAMLLGCYLYAIKGLPLSMAYTIATTLSIAGITCVGVVIYGEVLSMRAIIGVVVVMSGVLLISTS